MTLELTDDESLDLERTLDALVRSSGVARCHACGTHIGHKPGRRDLEEVLRKLHAAGLRRTTPTTTRSAP